MATPPSHLSLPPTAALTPCPACGALVLTRVWVMGTKQEAPHWRTLAEAVEPVTGAVHQCPTTITQEV